jgi:hypothetical protein
MKSAKIKIKCIKKWLDEKRSQDIHQNRRDFPNITLDGWESAIVAMIQFRRLVGSTDQAYSSGFYFRIA